MNIAFGRASRFNQMLRLTPGMSKRILAMRLAELERGGFIAKAEERRGFVTWELTPKGADVLPVILTLLHFDAKWRTPRAAGTRGDDPVGSEFLVAYRRVGPTRASDMPAPIAEK